MYRIRAIGAAFLRQRAVWLLPLWHLIFPLAEVAKVLTGNKPEPNESDVWHQLTVLRTAFRNNAAKHSRYCVVKRGQSGSGHRKPLRRIAALIEPAARRSTPDIRRIARASVSAAYAAKTE